MAQPSWGTQPMKSRTFILLADGTWYLISGYRDQDSNLLPSLHASWASLCTDTYFLKLSSNPLTMPDT